MTTTRPVDQIGSVTAGEQSSEDLFHRWQTQGDERARDCLVRQYLPLARKLAMRYQGAHEPHDDLIQVASLGLLGAIDRFDASRGVSFSSFAVPTILGELKRYFRDAGWSLHVPRGAQERAVRVEQAARDLAVEQGRSPTVNEIAEYLEMSMEQVLEAMEAVEAHHATSLETPCEENDEESGTLGDSVGMRDDGFARAEDAATIQSIAQNIPERDRRVLALRFVSDCTQDEIAEDVGISQMQVSRILRHTIDRMSKLAGVGAAA
ncbi:MAG: SigB/SigF/SigG family RNA polymerase sigma factor [Solirubrobacterales bacterium]|nr:SigB/SigF/SigG family RNA polymerase sigma factor [Solirubrobacterales bacterium]